jgi:hypothetical protein
MPFLIWPSLSYIHSAQLKEIEKWPNDGSLAARRLINCILLPCSPFLCALVFPLFWMYWILNLCHVMSSTIVQSENAKFLIVKTRVQDNPKHLLSAQAKRFFLSLRWK